MILKMKKELYSHFIYLHSLFKTTELKISSNNNLEVNEISALGSVQLKIDLTNTELKITNNKQNKYNDFLISLLLLGSVISSLFQFAFSNKPELLFPLLSISLVLISGVLIFIKFKTKKVYSLYRTSNNKLIYQFCLDSELSKVDDINDFIDELANRISKENKLDSYLDVNYNQSNTEEQYNNLIYNLECLYNSGMIDDMTFDRINSNINDKLYPNENKEARHVAEVIYLHNL